MKETGLRLPEELYENLKRVAEWNHRSLNSEIVAALEQWVRGAFDARAAYEARKAQLSGPY